MTDMTNQQREAFEAQAHQWWLEICEQFQMSMDGSYYDAALEMARRAAAAERERCEKIVKSLCRGIDGGCAIDAIRAG